MNKLELQSHPTLLGLIEACQKVQDLPPASQVDKELQIAALTNSLEYLLNLYILIARPGFENGAKVSVRSYDEVSVSVVGFAGARENLFLFDLTFDNGVTLPHVSMDEIVVLPPN